MTEPIDPDGMALFLETLKYWNFTDYIQWKRIARDWLYRELAYTERGFTELMFDYVSKGGKVDQVMERRPEYLEYRFHYDIRMPVSGRRIYVEMVLVADTPVDATIFVVSIHDA